MGGCSLDESELEDLEAQQGHNKYKNQQPDLKVSQLPLSWRAAKGANSRTACACKTAGGNDLKAHYPRTCSKCRTIQAQAASRQGDALCADCLWSLTLAKVMHAVRFSKVAEHDDHLLLAFSGGPGSRALLHYMSSLHNPRTARVTRGLLNFDMTIVYVDEGAAWSLSTKESASCVAAAAAAVAQYLPAFHFVTVPLEDVYTLPSALSAASDAEWLLEDRQHEGCIQQSQQPQQPSYLSRRLLDVGMAVDNGSSECSGSAPVQENGISSAAVNSPAVSSNNALRPGLLARERRSALQRLLKRVKDQTGLEDLVAHLRRILLLGVAARLKCHKVALGTSSTSQAAHIMAAVSKGSGYALPADLQFLDARASEAIIVKPVRDISSRDLALVCHFQRLELVSPPTVPQTGSGQSINSLCRDFVEGMQSGLPSAISTIVRTASKLKAFGFNHKLADPGGKDPVCSLCSAPLADAELKSLVTTASSDLPQGAQFSAACCRSCQQYIVCHLNAEDESSLLPPIIAKRTHGLLYAAGQVGQPAASCTRTDNNMTMDNMRISIADLLLSDSEEDGET